MATPRAKLLLDTGAVGIAYRAGAALPVDRLHRLGRPWDARGRKRSVDGARGRIVIVDAHASTNADDTLVLSQ